MTELLTSKELAAALKRSIDYIYAMRRAGFYMPGKRAKLSDALAWLSKNPDPTGKHNPKGTMIKREILSELLEFRKKELEAGRDPTEIKLTEDQRRRLRAYCDSTSSECVLPDGRRYVSYGMNYMDGVVFGMRYDP